jgi:ParB family chromosome partitioning protein
MDMFEQAQAMSGTMRLCGITQRELAERMGVSQSYVANKIRLLGLSEEIRELIRQSGITERHARALLRLGTEEERRAAADKMIRMRLTVRQSEALIDSEHPMPLPRQTQRVEKVDALEGFRHSLRRGVEVLRSFGIEARITTSYHGGKEYITVEAPTDY